MNVTLLAALIIVAAVPSGAAIAEEAFDPKVTLQVESASLQDLVNTVVLETGFAFFVDANITERDGISIDVLDAPVSMVFASLRRMHSICAWRNPAHPVTSVIIELKSWG